MSSRVYKPDYSKPVIIQRRAPKVNEHAPGQRVAVIDTKGIFWGNYLKVQNWMGDVVWMPCDIYWGVF